jgi:hypothetical protein
MVKAALAVPVARTGRSGVLEPGQVPAVSKTDAVSVYMYLMKSEMWKLFTYSLGRRLECSRMRHSGR